jgi:hypothetical protein
MCFPARVEATARTKPPREQKRERRHSGAAYPRARCWASGGWLERVSVTHAGPGFHRGRSLELERLLRGFDVSSGPRGHGRLAPPTSKRAGPSQGSRGSNAYVSTTPRTLVLRTSRRGWVRRSRSKSRAELLAYGGPDLDAQCLFPGSKRLSEPLVGSGGQPQLRRGPEVALVVGRPHGVDGFVDSRRGWSGQRSDALSAVARASAMCWTAATSRASR